MRTAFRTPIYIIEEGDGYRDPNTGEWIEGGWEITNETLANVQPLKEGRNLTFSQQGQFYIEQNKVLYIQGRWELPSDGSALIYADGKYYQPQGSQDWSLAGRGPKHTKILCAEWTGNEPDVEIPSE